MLCCRDLLVLLVNPVLQVLVVKVDRKVHLDQLVLVVHLVLRVSPDLWAHLVLLGKRVTKVKLETQVILVKEVSQEHLVMRVLVVYKVLQVLEASRLVSSPITNLFYSGFLHAALGHS